MLLKKSILIFLLFPLLIPMAQGQLQPGKQQIGKKYPSFIKVKEKVNKNQVEQLFKKHFKLSINDDLVLVNTRTDKLGYTHDIYQQFYNGIKVEGARYSVHSKNGVIEMMSGNFRDIFKHIEKGPGISPITAFNAATNNVNAQSYVWDQSGEMPEGEIVIIADHNGMKEPRLAYKCDIYALNPLSRADVYIDAHSGEIIGKNQTLHENDVVGTGTSLYNGTVNFTANHEGAIYRLRQQVDGNGIETYSMNNGTNYNNATDVTSNSSNFTTDPAGVQAHWGAEQTHQYFLQNHSRNSFDDNGAVIKSYVHYSSGYVNAFWDGQRMTYGDGDGVNYGPLVSLDIVGHEITHGVTTFSANLVYSYESGALNESFSDIFGEAIENFSTGSNNWQMGTDIGIGRSGAIRSMNNPKAFGDPDTYLGTNWHTAPSDNGGVHINSGVQNKWFYILSEGESGSNDNGDVYNVTGIGIEKAAVIAYRNLTVYLSSNSQYNDARVGAIQAAIDLFGAGSAEEIATTNAWYAVGVGGEYGSIFYCNSNANSSYYEWVSSVTIGSFNHTSGAANYSDFTQQTIDVIAGESYSVNLIPAFRSAGYSEYWKIWIDYNADGDFDDEGELAFDAGSLSTTTVTGNLTIPSGASGDTRMRVSMKYNSAQTPCETFAYGEVEDYSISINPAGADTEAPSTPENLSTSNTSQTSTELSWSSSTDNVAVTGYNVYVDDNLIGSTTSNNFDINNLSPGTTYTLEVEAEDAAGNISPKASIMVSTLSNSGGSKTILSHYFETGWDGWTDGGSDCYRHSGSRSYEGKYSIRIRDNSGTASAMTSSSYDLSSYNQLEIEFYFFSSGMEKGEDFWLRYYDGNSWHTIGVFVRGTHFNNSSFYKATVSISSSQYAFPNNAQFRFQCDASANSDRIYIDAVKIKASNTSSLKSLAGLGKSTIQKFEVTPLLDSPPLVSGTEVEEESISFYEDVYLFPNPVKDFLNIRKPEGVQKIKILGLDGQVWREIDNMDYQMQIDVSNLSGGFYFLVVQREDEVITKKFIKE